MKRYNFYILLCTLFFTSINFGMMQKCSERDAVNYFLIKELSQRYSGKGVIDKHIGTMLMALNDKEEKFKIRLITEEYDLQFKQQLEARRRFLQSLSSEEQRNTLGLIIDEFLDESIPNKIVMY